MVVVCNYYTRYTHSAQNYSLRSLYPLDSLHSLHSLLMHHSLLTLLTTHYSLLMHSCTHALMHSCTHALMHYSLLVHYSLLMHYSPYCIVTTRHSLAATHHTTLTTHLLHSLLLPTPRPLYIPMTHTTQTTTLTTHCPLPTTTYH